MGLYLPLGLRSSSLLVRTNELDRVNRAIDYYGVNKTLHNTCTTQAIESSAEKAAMPDYQTKNYNILTYVHIIIYVSTKN